MSEPWFAKDVRAEDLPRILEWGRQLELIARPEPEHKFLEFKTWTMRVARGVVDFHIPVGHPRRPRCALGKPDAGDEFCVAEVMTLGTYRELVNEPEYRPERDAGDLHVSWHSGLPEPLVQRLP